PNDNLLGRSLNRGTTNAMGVLGGVQASWLYQAVGSRYVWGAEAQYSFANLKGDHGDSLSSAGLLQGLSEGEGEGGSHSGSIFGTLNERFATKVTGVGTLAFKFGYAAFDNRVLFFGKVGGAYAREKYSLSSQFSVLATGIGGEGEGGSNNSVIIPI